MKINTASQFQPRTGMSASKGLSDKTEQTAQSTTDTAALRDSFEQSPKRSLFADGASSLGARFRGSSQQIPPLTKLCDEHIDGYGDIDPATPGKQSIDLGEVEGILTARDDLDHALNYEHRTPPEDANAMAAMDRLDILNALTRSYDLDLRIKAGREGGQHSPMGEPPTMMKVDKLEDDSGGGRPALTPLPGGGSDAEGGIGPKPGRGRRLGARTHEGPGRCEDGPSSTNRNQKADGKNQDSAGWGTSSNSGDAGGVRGRGKDGTTSSTHTDNTEAGGTGGDTTCEQPRSERDPWGYVEDGVDSQMCRDEDTGLPPADPATGGGSGDDLGGGKLSKYKTSGVTQQQKDLVGDAVGKTTGADDKDRPDTSGASGTVATDQSESRSDDLGSGKLPGRRGGGSIDVSAGDMLLKSLGVWEKMQPGGPDPAK